MAFFARVHKGMRERCRLLERRRIRRRARQAPDNAPEVLRGLRYSRLMAAPSPIPAWIEEERLWPEFTKGNAESNQRPGKQAAALQQHREEHGC